MPDEHTAHTEPDHVRAKPVLAVTIGFVVFAGISAVALLAYYKAAVGPGLFVPPRPFPAPQLQTTPLSDLETLQAVQRARIEGYGWVDRGKGLYRIPIKRAMEIVASKGAAALEPLEQPPSPQQSPAVAAEQIIESESAAQAPSGGRQ